MVGPKFLPVVIITLVLVPTSLRLLSRLPSTFTHGVLFGESATSQDVSWLTGGFRATRRHRNERLQKVAACGDNNRCQNGRNIWRPYGNMHAYRTRDVEAFRLPLYAENVSSPLGAAEDKLLEHMRDRTSVEKRKAAVQRFSGDRCSRGDGGKPLEASDRVLKELCKAIYDPEVEVRILAAHALRSQCEHIADYHEWKVDPHIARLAMLMNRSDCHPLVRAYTADAFGHLEEFARPYNQSVTWGLHHEDARVRASSMRCLYNWGWTWTKNFHRFISPRRRDEDPEVRYWANNWFDQMQYQCEYLSKRPAWDVESKLQNRLIWRKYNKRRKYTPGINKPKHGDTLKIW